MWTKDVLEAVAALEKYFGGTVCVDRISQPIGTHYIVFKCGETLYGYDYATKELSKDGDQLI